MIWCRMEICAEECRSCAAVAATRHGFQGDAIAPRHIVEGVQSLLQVPASIAQRIDAVEGFRTHGGHV
jgi:hypothetical protein